MVERLAYVERVTYLDDALMVFVSFSILAFLILVPWLWYSFLSYFFQLTFSELFPSGLARTKAILDFWLVVYLVLYTLQSLGLVYLGKVVRGGIGQSGQTPLLVLIVLVLLQRAQNHFKYLARTSEETTE